MSTLTTRQIIGQHPWLNTDPRKRPFLRGRAYHITKRSVDLLITVALFPVLLPLLGLCALAVKIESPGGSVLFTQNRTGRNGQRFRMYKFRTMVPNAEELKQQLAHLNEFQWPDFKIANDPRITQVGRLLRKTSLDELPQLWNVLIGDMSLVGPRPTSFSAETYSLWHTHRLDVLPGVTGLWQIIGRGQTEFDNRLRIDIAYIERRCIWLDLKILFFTIPAVVKQRGAH